MEKIINNYGNIGKKSRSNKIHYHAYHRFYPIFLAHYRDIPCKLLEIGLENTFSIKIWRDYLPKSFIYGIDIDKKETKIKNTKLLSPHRCPSLRSLSSLNFLQPPTTPCPQGCP